MIEQKLCYNLFPWLFKLTNEQNKTKRQTEKDQLRNWYHPKKKLSNQPANQPSNHFQRRQYCSFWQTENERTNDEPIYTPHVNVVCVCVDIVKWYFTFDFLFFFCFLFIIIIIIINIATTAENGLYLDIYKTIIIINDQHAMCNMSRVRFFFFFEICNNFTTSIRK